MPLYHQFGDGSHKQTRVEIKLDSFRLNEICERCNNDWMSQLEDAAKPLLLGLIRRERLLSNLNEEERGIVAAWAGKTAIVESRTVGAECPISGEFLNQIRLNGGIATRKFAVAACISGKKSFAHMQVGIICDLIGGGKASGNIIVLAIPNLAFVCAFPMLPIPFQCKCVKSFFTPIWPPADQWRDMDQTAMPDGLQGIDHLAAMAERIELFQSVK
jgi:hypothetical protein